RGGDARRQAAGDSSTGDNAAGKGATGLDGGASHWFFDTLYWPHPSHTMLHHRAAEQSNSGASQEHGTGGYLSPNALASMRHAMLAVCFSEEASQKGASPWLGSKATIPTLILICSEIALLPLELRVPASWTAHPERRGRSICLSAAPPRYVSSALNE